jgi:hypothetical protein
VLLAETARAAGVERRATADLLALLAEVDRRRIYLGLGYSSLFMYCTRALHLSEPAAYMRITAARAAARWPAILTRLAAGDLTLTAVTLLAAHLTEENHEALLDAARHKTRRDIDRLVASLDPQPDVPPVLRRLPAPAAPAASIATSLPAAEPDVLTAAARPRTRTSSRFASCYATPCRPVIRRPLSRGRFRCSGNSSSGPATARRIAPKRPRARPRGPHAMCRRRSGARCGAAMRADALLSARMGAATPGASWSSIT